MSLILEALKKAERQHRMGEVPGIAAGHYEEASKGSRLLGIVLVGGMAIGMLALGLYLGEESPPSPTAEETKPQIHVVPNPGVVHDRKSDVLSQKKASPPPPTPKVVPPKRAPETTLAKPIQSTARAPAKAESKPAVNPVKPRSKKPPIAAPKPLSELPGDFVDKLPELNIDIHSYDANAQKRYVLINMEKYREGDRLNEGILLSNIRPDGVVLEYEGQRFILPIGNY